MSTQDLENIPTNLSENEHFQDVVNRVAMSRRSVIKSGVGLSAAMFLGGSLAACSDDDNGATGSPVGTISFAAIAANSGDSILVPPGYQAQVIAPWGAPLFQDSPSWKGDASESADDQAKQVGDNHDGMHFFAIPGTDSNKEGLLVMNHEYINPEYFYAPGPDPMNPMEPWTLDKVRKALNAHGVSVIHVRKNSAGKWEIVIGSFYNRRITGRSPMDITGPAAGHNLMKTTADSTGRRVFGTLNNCGNGFTPWGTYLTCEENFNGYFGTLDGAYVRDANQLRYGMAATGFGYRWHEQDDRFDYAVNPNEANRHGWIVEIDPYDPTSLPKKRTALGRIKHENAALTISKDGHVVVYMGDDQVNDYVYKFVSTGKYIAGNLANNRDLLDSGKLYVAKFENGATAGDAAGIGKWILLDKTANATLNADANFADQGEVLVKTRLAADAVGATKMDRPEWVTVHPTSQEVYITMTNNSGRTVTDDANPRAANRWGQIVRWREAGNDPASVADFAWDLFVIAGNPHAFTDARAGSANVTTANSFNSPDGLAFDAEGRLWIQTDGNYSNTGNFLNQGNNQMLVADVKTKKIDRFLVGPAGCEITGITWTPDGRTMFINVQHPGEASGHPNAPTPTGGMSLDVFLTNNPTSFSTWPDRDPDSRPRSATVVISRTDGGKIGT
ncbi:MAG: PhoX family phosphatase [Moraxellaceae bacterium]|nr:PhoX family phosphatase [Moraxellaceae bacterium]